MDKLDYKLRRRSLGLTQQELADILGIHVRTVRRREYGEPIPLEAAYDIRELCSIDETFNTLDEVEAWLHHDDRRYAYRVHPHAHAENLYAAPEPTDSDRVLLDERLERICH
jgi:transcriptional regulator with XRE-family HTH domain